MSEVVDCLNELINDVMVNAQSYGISYSEGYFNKINAILTEIGDVNELTFSEYKGHDIKQNRMRADGYFFEIEDGSDALNIKEMMLVVADYGYDTVSGDVTELDTLNTGDLEKKFKEMTRFIRACSTPNFREDIAKSSEYFELVDLLTRNFSKLEKITILYATTSRFSGLIKEFEAEEIHGIRINKQLYDITRHHAIITSKDGSEPTQIEFEEYGFESLTALKTNDDDGNTQSMLLAVPGDLLFRIYDKHGARLLEQNVRTYLQARGNVNKGMIATLRENPERFFSYNNGLTATASEIIVKDKTDTTISISGIKNLQIVNGGQTTASIHYAKFKNEADLSRVFVQMKLSVVDPELLQAIVPKIAQYANTQNKVNVADFFANHPFHRRFKYLSEENSTPKQDNTISSYGTYWYYERARGAYNNETYKLRRAAAKKEFSNRHPKHQLIIKTDLAKYLMSFDRHPDVVSKGAQAAFVQHAIKIGLPEDFEKKTNEYNEIFYREAIAKAIIFRKVDKLVQTSDWYEGGGSKACTVTYAIAWFSEHLHSKDFLLDFQKVWACQSLTSELEQIFIGLLPKIYQFLKDSTPEHLSAVTQWAKRKGCWDKLREEFEHHIDEELLDAVLTTKELKKELVKSAKKQQKEFNEDFHWIKMSNIKSNAWVAIKVFLKKHNIWKTLTPNQQRDINRLSSLSDTELRVKYITEKEAANLLPIFDELNKFDFDFESYGIDSLSM